MPATLRLFFALWPDEGTRGALERLSEAMHRACGGRRVSADKLHATLAFLGAQPAARVPELISAASAVGAPAFELVLDEARYWKHNRIGWTGASRVPEAVEVLSRLLREELSARGFAFDPKPFVPHVTLVRDASRPQELPAFTPIRWPVQSFSLVHSSGGRYSVLASTPLRSRLG